MVDIDRFHEMVEELAAEIPEALTAQLNGGIHTRPEPLPSSQINGYILGQYHQQHAGLGRYIVLYYGSFEAMFSHLDEDLIKEKIGEILLHELTHHLESLAGVNDLVAEDNRNLAKWKKQQKT